MLLYLLEQILFTVKNNKKDGIDGLQRAFAFTVRSGSVGKLVVRGIVSEATE